MRTGLLGVVRAQLARETERRPPCCWLASVPTGPCQRPVRLTLTPEHPGHRSAPTASLAMVATLLDLDLCGATGRRGRNRPATAPLGL
jgi:hypothetical protein